MAADYENLGLFYLGKRYDLASNTRQEDLILYDSRDLLTHGVILGMTGSGKTGLAITLLEEAAIDGVPVLAIDPKGDLTNLLLTFPNLAPSDFAPWVDDGEALQGFQWLARHEGILPALESAHAIAWLRRGLSTLPRDAVVLLNLSGRGDKDVDTVRALVGTGPLEAAP